MSSSLFFQEDALDVVDEWLGTSEADGGEELQRSSNAPVNISESSLVKSFKKARNNKTPSKYATSGAAESDSEDEDYDDLGGAGNKMPASRTSAVDSKKSSSNKRKLVEITAKEIVPPVAANKESKNVVKQSQNNSSGCGNHEGEGEVKRKRTKTRSKQKNIRRDNRTEAVKPDHLQYSSESYAGRPLTEKTIVVLEDKYNKMQHNAQASLHKKGNNNKTNDKTNAQPFNHNPSGSLKGKSWKKGDKDRGAAADHKVNMKNKGKGAPGSVTGANADKKPQENSDIGWSLDTNKG
mgnify:CR=1 FL=1